MQRFTQLFIEMDRTKRTSEKVAAMERYFREVPSEDAAWALYFLSGRKLKRLVPSGILHDAIAQITSLPEWIISESYQSVGDFAETLALLFPQSRSEPATITLSQLVSDRMLRLRSIAASKNQRALILQTWNDLDSTQRLVFNKLITSNFRVGVTQTLVIRALAVVADVTPAIMAHRFAGTWEPTADSYARLMTGGDRGDSAGPSIGDLAQPYPFYLAHPLMQPPEDLGTVNDWQIEWKYDGLRAQLIHREQSTLIWSRGDELISGAFPEIAEAAADLPPNTVLDGEIIAWEDDRPLPFALLQRRINRKQVEAALWTDVPVAFIAFDVLEENGNDLREQPLVDRRRKLDELLSQLPPNASIKPAPLLSARTWSDLSQHRLASREHSVEGVMLKRLSSTYGVGRKRGDWWKWKIDPYTVDAVLIYAQGGSGRRSGLFTDYTFGVWDRPDESQGNGGDGRELVPVAKAYSGLTDDEIRQVDRFIRRNTIEKRGPVRIVKPELVFELAFEAIQPSNRHKAGLAIRFPRMNRWRTDKKPEDADTLETLQALLRSTMRENREER
ncbi:MAG: ATP-dependent DNA ligase [Phycisphaerales bacterium]|nr:ATP-dependent DNA ligase [Phycisphaerales bacterium]